MKILIIYYSLYGNTFKMARAVAEGAASLPAAEVSLLRVPDSSLQEIAGKSERVRNAQILQKEIPVARVEYLPEASAVILGSPTRYGSICSPVKNFIDQTGALWSKGGLEGKFGGAFTCSSTAHGSSEATLLSILIQLLNWGMIVMGIPLSANEALAPKTGGSFFGASSVVGPTSDISPGENDLKLARLLGRRVAQAAVRR